MKRYYVTIGVVVMIFCFTTISFAAGYERFFGNDSSTTMPAGWSKGEKKGWNGQKLPPGISKKDTTSVSDDGNIASPPLSPDENYWTEDRMKNAKPYPMERPSLAPETGKPSDDGSGDDSFDNFKSFKKFTKEGTKEFATTILNTFNDLLEKATASRDNLLSSNSGGPFKENNLKISDILIKFYTMMIDEAQRVLSMIDTNSFGL